MHVDSDPLGTSKVSLNVFTFTSNCHWGQSDAGHPRTHFKQLDSIKIDHA